MSNDQDNGGLMAIGGLIAVVAIFGVVMKFLHGVFIQLTKTFNAFTVMLSSMFGSLWSTAEFAILVSLIGGSVVCAIYFTYKHILLVRKATEVRAYVSETVMDYQSEMLSKLQSFEARVEEQIEAMREVLSEALKKPEVELAPQASPETVSDETTKALQQIEISEENNERGTDADLSAVINPY